MDRRYKPMTALEETLARQALYERFADQAHLPVAETLRLIRQTLRLTRADLARLSGLSVRYISDLENGTGNPTLSTLDKVLHPFGLTVRVGLT